LGDHPVSPSRQPDAWPAVRPHCLPQVAWRLPPVVRQLRRRQGEWHRQQDGWHRQQDEVQQPVRGALTVRGAPPAQASNDS
jgi:hypothetical protein